MKKSKEIQKKRINKFPAARIKRIMQSDEEIGKVSTSAPIVLGKAIELFMKDIIMSSVEISKKNKSSKITMKELENLISESVSTCDKIP
ncbi:hypothetical protein CWI36_0685p0040 [Hamiltosporidium magnivora]|uniref:Transcription factor CBF/NF-Y/archaeal histone domain-containing protein n=1 Tax=Hamiltosporidium magnivora TaxID=148818 RepID=A0A4Q9LB32_9MICR|nr:hypothetical protein CWI36_0685p0040 [Hamiltosporidium magnivora]